MTIKEKMQQINEGRFFDILEPLRINDACLECNRFYAEANESYRCAIMGVCPGVTLSEKFKEYLLSEGGFVNEASTTTEG